MTPPRQHPRRRLLGRRPPAVHHAPVDVSRETSTGPFVAGGQVPDPADAARALVDAVLEASPEQVDRLRAVAEELAPPPLSKDRIAKLEAMTAQWIREVRIGGPGPDDTLLYSGPASLPPVPPARRPETVTTRTETPAVPTDAEVEAATAAAVQARHDRNQDEPAPHPLRGQRWADILRDPTKVAQALEPTPPRRVSDWSSRHDPRSLEYGVRDRLSRPVPLQDFQLEVGPILDQGTTPPLSVREASRCTGTAAVAAANVLRLAAAPAHARPADVPLLGLEDASRVYHRAQELDHVSGENYAGTSVLAAMKAGQEEGWWDTYLWALGGTRDVAQALLQLRSPVVVGVPWSTGLEEPSPSGVIQPTGTPNGGHALTVVGLRLALRGVGGPWFCLQQSRGTSEGVGGLVYLHHTDLGRLLAGQGEAAVPLHRWGLE